MKIAYGVLAACLLSYAAQAQTDSTATQSKKHHTLSIGTDGIKFTNKDGRDTTINYKEVQEKAEKEEKSVSLEYLILDIGVNAINDKTNYMSADAQTFIQASLPYMNKNLFDLRTAKSINVNLDPIVAKFRLVKNKSQKVYFYAGVGFQFYNFRYAKNISYRNDATPYVTLDTVSFSKNKLSITYLMVPLGFTLKSRLAEKTWLVYGAGVTGGYRIDSWTKQISGERGKQKNHDRFGLADFNACITGEIGLDNYFRLFGSYQVTSMYEHTLDQHPFSIGIRFGGI